MMVVAAAVGVASCFGAPISGKSACAASASWINDFIYLLVLYLSFSHLLGNVMPPLIPPPMQCFTRSLLSDLTALLVHQVSMFIPLSHRPALITSLPNILVLSPCCLFFFCCPVGVQHLGFLLRTLAQWGEF